MNTCNIITFGTFDLLHIGHINILKQAKNNFSESVESKLIVGISTDIFSFNKKQRYPIYNQEQRKIILESLRFVDEVFFEESLDLKREYIEQYKADILIMGDDWEGKFDYLNDICKVVYLPRTPSISTTEIIELINK